MNCCLFGLLCFSEENTKYRVNDLLSLSHTVCSKQYEDGMDTRETPGFTTTAD